MAGSRGITKPFAIQNRSFSACGSVTWPISSLPWSMSAALGWSGHNPPNGERNAAALAGRTAFGLLRKPRGRPYMR